MQDSWIKLIEQLQSERFKETIWSLFGSTEERMTENG